MPFNVFDAGQAIRQGNAAALEVAKMDEYARGRERDRTVREAGKAAVADDGTMDAQVFAQELAKSGMVRESMEIQNAIAEQKLSRAKNDFERFKVLTDGLTAFSKGAANIRTPEGYQAGRNLFTKLFPEAAEVLPQDFSPASREALSVFSGQAAEQFRLLSGEDAQAAGLPAGAVAQQNARTGETDMLYTPPKDATYRDMTPEEMRAAGLPEGGLYQRTSRGQIQEVYAPREPKPTASANKQRELEAQGVPRDVARGVAYGTVREIQSEGREGTTTRFLDMSTQPPREIGSMGPDGTFRPANKAAGGGPGGGGRSGGAVPKPPPGFRLD